MGGLHKSGETSTVQPPSVRDMCGLSYCRYYRCSRRQSVVVSRGSGVQQQPFKTHTRSVGSPRSFSKENVQPDISEGPILSFVRTFFVKLN